MIAILGPTATFLSPQAFDTFCGTYVRDLIMGVAGKPGTLGTTDPADAAGTAGAARTGAAAPMTILHICGDSSHLVKNMCAAGAEGLGLDSAVGLARAAREVDPEVVLIGNVDPVGVMVQETPEGVRRAVRTLLDSTEPYENFILSTGCDLPYETPFENIDAFMREGRL